jgi:hypothetical protein
VTVCCCCADGHVLEAFAYRLDLNRLRSKSCHQNSSSVVIPSATYSQLRAIRSYFKDKVFAISGGNGAMGRATARLLILHGARVSLADVQIDGLINFLGNDEDESHAQWCYYTIAVCSEQDVQQWIDRTVQDYGPPDGCVNFAGILSENFLSVSTVRRGLSHRSDLNLERH